jgi:DNA-binding IclR family transcriptional regulator
VETTDDVTEPTDGRPKEVAGAQTLFRALNVLDCFIEVGPVLSLKEISDRVGLTVPTTHRLVRALISRDMVVVDRHRRYSLGPAVMRLASVIMHRSEDLAAVVAPTLLRLRDETGETTSLHSLVGHERVCITEFVSPQPIRMESRVGRAYPLYAGAAGKAILAWAPELQPEVMRQLEAVGPSTITDPETLRKELTLIVKRGYAESNSETVAGASAVAAPLFDSTGRVLAAINIAGPSSRFNRDAVRSARDALLREVSSAMRLLASLAPTTVG